MSNEELVLSFQNGNKEALEQLYKNNMGVINKISYSISMVNGMPNGEIEDYKQEAFFVVENCAKLYLPDKNIKFVTYFTRALITRLLRYKSRNKSYKDMSIYSPIAGDDELLLVDTIKDDSLRDNDDILEDLEIKENVRKALDRLPELTASIVYLCYGEEIKTEKVMEQYNITADQVNILKKNGINSLRRDMMLKLFWQRYIMLERILDIESMAYHYHKNLDEIVGPIIDREFRKIEKSCRYELNRILG